MASTRVIGVGGVNVFLFFDGMDDSSPDSSDVASCECSLTYIIHIIIKLVYNSTIVHFLSKLFDYVPMVTFAIYLHVLKLNRQQR